MGTWNQESRFSTASGDDLPYVVLQVTLKEKFFGTGSGNLTDLEEVINAQVAKGYRLHICRLRMAAVRVLAAVTGFRQR